MTVIYPVPPGGVAPTFTRLDDDTVQVVNGAQTDVISFNPQTTNIAQVTFLVDSPGVWSNAPPLPQPPPLTNTAYIVTPPPPAAAVVIVPPSNLRIIPPAAVDEGTSALASSPFTPPAGYFAWWDPDTLTGGNNAPVQEWVDLSANKFQATQPVYGDEPSLQAAAQNGHNYLIFNGSSDFLTNNTCGTINQPIEIFCVVAPSNAPVSGCISGNSSGGPTCFGIGNSSFWMNANDSVGGGTATNGWVEITAVINDKSAELFEDGNLVISGNRTGNNPQTGETIGAYYNSGMTHFFNGAIGDLIIYTNVLSTPAQQSLEQALRAKYGF